MKKYRILKLTALLLLTVFLLTSCLGPLKDLYTGWGFDENDPDSFSVSREELRSLIGINDSHISTALDQLSEIKQLSMSAANIEELYPLFESFDELYCYIDDQVSLLMVLADLDLGDTSAKEKYLGYYEQFTTVYELYVLTMKDIHKESPYSSEIFADWSEEDIAFLYSHDPRVSELNLRAEEIILDIEAASSESDIARLYTDLVLVNNEIARLSGYTDYYSYASSEVYRRDYGSDSIDRIRTYAARYLKDELPILEKRYTSDFALLTDSSYDALLEVMREPFYSLPENHVTGYVKSFSGSTGRGFSHMLREQNSIFALGKNARPGAYTFYFSGYETPFCYFSSDYLDSFTVIHEMGHYYSGLYSFGDVSFDLAELQSQANEMLFLDYLDGRLSRRVYNALYSYMLYDYVSGIILCLIVDEFEKTVYTASDIEEYTLSDYDRIIETVASRYGGIEYVERYIGDVKSYWKISAATQPIYYLSYATSRISALGILALASQDTSAARDAYKSIVEDCPEGGGFLETLESLGIDSPFDEEVYEMINRL